MIRISWVLLKNDWNTVVTQNLLKNLWWPKIKVLWNIQVFLESYTRGNHMSISTSLPLQSETRVSSTLPIPLFSEVQSILVPKVLDGVTRWFLIFSELAELSGPWVLEISSVPLILLHRTQSFLIFHNSHVFHCSQGTLIYFLLNTPSSSRTFTNLLWPPPRIQFFQIICPHGALTSFRSLLTTLT